LGVAFPLAGGINISKEAYLHSDYDRGYDNIMAKKNKKQVIVRVAAPKSTRARRTREEKKEVTLLGHALRSLGGMAGTAVGGAFGNPIAGGAVGTSLGATISKWLGSGDYTVSSNSIINRIRSTDSVPVMYTADSSVVIRHREYIGEIRSSTTFTVQDSLELNPGNPRTFPWLSGVAVRFQAYRFRGVVFHYIPSSGNAVSSSNPALGTVMLQTSYRSSDAAPISKTEVLNEYWASETVPSDSLAHPIECDPKENPYKIQYVRNGAVPASDSKLIYDLGVTHVCTSGQQTSGNVIGDLWVTYEVELKKPIVSSNVTSTVASSGLTWKSGNYAAADFMNGTLTRFGSLLVTGATRTLTFPEGVYGNFLIALRFDGTLTGLDLSSTSYTFTNCTQTAVFSDGSNYGRNVLTSGSLSQAFALIAVFIPDPAQAASITYPSFATLTGSITAVNIVITPFVA